MIDNLFVDAVDPKFQALAERPNMGRMREPVEGGSCQRGMASLIGLRLYLLLVAAGFRGGPCP